MRLIDYLEYKTISENNNLSKFIFDFLCIGDGIHDDTDNIKFLITKVGIGGTINLIAGETYLISSEIRLLPGQTIYFNGATFKRADQKHSVTIGAVVIAGTTTSFTVADGTQFKIGDSIAIADETRGTKNNYTSAKQITNIVGNTITINAPFVVGEASYSAINEYPYYANRTFTPSNYSFPIGSTVAAVFDLLTVTTECSLFRPKIDGNKDYQFIAHWDLYAEIHVTNHETGSLNDVLIDRPYIYNFASEAILEGGGSELAGYNANGDYPGPINDDMNNSVNVTYNYPRIVNGNGNGIHLSGINFPKIKGGFFYNLNQNYGVGHVGGGVSISFTGMYLDFQDAYVERCYSGISEFFCRSASNFTIKGNKFKNCYGYALCGYDGVVDSPGYRKLIIQGNRFINCNLVKLASNQVDVSRCAEAIASDNILIGTAVLVDSFDDAIIHHNIVKNDYTAQQQCSAGSVLATATTIPVASTGRYKLNQMINLSLNGVVSRDVKITAIATDSQITFTPAIGIAFDSAPFINDPEKPIHTTCPVGFVITSGSTTVYQVNDASNFYIGQFICLDQPAVNVIQYSRVLAVDKFSTPNTITVQTASNRTLTAGTGKNTIYVWPNPLPLNYCVNILSLGCRSTIDTNKSIGGMRGIETESGSASTQGTKISGNQVSKFRLQGIATATGAEINHVTDNIVDLDSAYADDWALGIWVRGKSRIQINEVSSNLINSSCMQLNGDKAIVNGNVLRAASGASPGSSLQASGATNSIIKDNYASVAMYGTAANGNSETGTITIS